MRIRSAAAVLALLSMNLALPITASGQTPVECMDTNGNHVPCSDTGTYTEPAPPDKNYAPTIRLSGGGLVDYGTDTGTGATYTARIEVEAPLSDWKLGPRLRTMVDLTQLPGASAPSALEGAQAFDSFKAIEFRAILVQPISDHLRFAPFIEAGFASRFTHEPNEPDARSPRWGCIGLTFTRTSSGELSPAICRDQRLDGLYQYAAEVGGRVDLWKAKNAQGEETGAVVSFVGHAILGLDASSLFPDRPELNGGRRDILRGGLTVSYGK